MPGYLSHWRVALAQRIAGRGMYVVPGRALQAKSVVYQSGNAAMVDYFVQKLPELKADDVSLALTVTVSVWAGRCIEQRCKAVSRIPWRVINKRTGSPVQNHPLYNLFDDAYARAKQNVLYNWEQSLSTHGETYLEKIVDDRSGWPAGLRWINPLAIEPWIMHGRLIRYDANDGDGRMVRFAPYQIVYHHYPNTLDDFRGRPPIVPALNALNISRGMQQVILSWLENDATPGGIITGRQGAIINEQDQEKIEKSWTAQHKGARNKFRWAVLGYPLEAKQFDVNLPQYQADLSEEQRSEICAALNVPKSMVDAGDVGDPLSAGGTMDIQTANFYEGWVIPECEDIEGVINADIMPWLDPTDASEFKWDFTELYSLIRSTLARSEKIRGEVQDGLLTLNEGRTKLGEKPLPGGDVLRIPAGAILVPVDRLSEAVELTRPNQPVALTMQPPALLPSPTAALTDPAKDTPLVPASVTGESAVIMLRLGAHPDLVALQRQVKDFCGDIPVEWNPPDTFHVTLFFAPVIDPTQLATLSAFVAGVDLPEDLTLRVGSLNQFEGVGKFPLHFRVRQNADLLDLQEQCYEFAAAQGIQASAYSQPDNFTPHITMGYAAQKPPRWTFNSKLAVAPRSIQVAQGDKVVYERLWQDEEDTTQKALGELGAWERKAASKGALKAAGFVCNVVDPDLAAYARSVLNTLSADDKGAVCNLFAELRELVGVRVKVYADTRQGFYGAILAYIADAQKEEINRRNFAARMRTALNRFGLRAFRDGFNDAGIDPESYTVEQLQVYRNWQTEQSGYVTNLGAEIFKQGITEAEVKARAEMWANMSLDGIYNLGRMLAKPGQRAKFKLGGTKEHCTDCAHLDGKVATREDWQKSGWGPRSGMKNRHACRQFRCECTLEDTDEPVNFDPFKYRSRGRKKAEAVPEPV